MNLEEDLKFIAFKEKIYEGLYERAHDALKEHKAEYMDISEAVKRVTRVRGGKIQRRKKVTNRKGYKIRNGKEVRMSSAERRNRKKSARRAAIKRRGKKSSANRARKKSMRIRKRRVSSSNRRKRR